MRFIRILLLVLAGLLLSACAPRVTLEQCKMTNWTQMGVQDGSSGQPQRDLKKFIDGCQRYKLIVDQSGYKKGWLQGVKTYCSPSLQSGKTDGTAGRSFGNIYSRKSFCQQNGFTLSVTQYKKGWQAGLKGYCNPSYDEGFSYGVSGLTADGTQGRSAVCHEGGLTLNAANAQKGYYAGLKKFCSYSSGYKTGLEGAQSQSVCRFNNEAEYLQGWRSGFDKYCSQPLNGFTLGKQDGSYPSLCDSARYAAFRAEYHRGQMVAQRIASLNSQIGDIDAQIRSLANTPGVDTDFYNDTYTLSDALQAGFTPDTEYDLETYSNSFNPESPAAKRARHQRNAEKRRTFQQEQAQKRRDFNRRLGQAKEALRQIESLKAQKQILKNELFQAKIAK